ncbi:hypothetical protein EXIGLDRAFT_118245 [Exidia glandulosa HHB12029]|uniref:MICOS complex subunit MIC60 n=1 Tax=Exidia glandulosa HHB12029 TaxID=1314781 RepID=A0A165GIB8_EXIGL|nr:hypothetical protein EXIGLDRAFT_118245 [Exidia glandulosa HHB12029]
MHRAAVSRTALSVVRYNGGQRAFADIASPGAPKPKKRVLRRLLLVSTLGGAAFYAGSTALALNSEPYRDFFLDAVPGAERIIQECERMGWDKLALSKTAKDTVEQAKKQNAQAAAQSAQARLQQQLQQHKATAKQRVQEGKSKAKDVAEVLVTKVERVPGKAAAAASSATQTVKDAANAVSDKAVELKDDITSAAAKPAAAFSDGVKELVDLIEEALNVKTEPPAAPASTEPAQPANVYQGKLPLGFEPPPGYTRPQAAKPAASGPPSTTPVKSVTLGELVASGDPQIARLAVTIESLSKFARENPSAAASVQASLTAARESLVELSSRLSAVPNEVDKKVHEELAKRDKEHTRAVIDLEITAQSRLDEVEDMWRAAFEAERRKIADAYKEKLHAELDAHTALIEERLKQEVVAQGIELQRRWIREVKMRVEQERAGRLAKLDELAADVQRLSAQTLDNASYLSENLRIHKVSSAVRALRAVLDRPSRTPFRAELRALADGAAHDDEVIGAALAPLAQSDIPDVGVDPLPDLAAWFASGVAVDVRRVALVPERGGVLAHAASAVLSTAAFDRRGLVEGADTLSVLSRASYHLEREDLDSACRELNQLEGTPRAVASEWLEAARRRLQVQQALEVRRSFLMTFHCLHRRSLRCNRPL